MLINNKLSQKVQKIIILVFFLVAFIYVPLVSNSLFQGDKDQRSSVDYLNLKLSAQEINVTTPENKTYFNPMSGYYPGTYGFENDIIGENPMDWTTLEGTCSVDIISALGNHNKVIEFYDDSTGGQKAEMRNNFTTPQVSGTIEFWIRFGSGADMRLDLFDAERDTDALLIRWGRSGSTNIEFYNDTYNLISTYSVNTWHHYRIQFDCTDDWHLWIDGVSQDNDIGYTYRNSPMNFTQFDLESHDTHENYYAYTDAIGYSWDPNYNIGDNLNEGLLLSYENSTILDWKGYSLDGAANKTILGYTTLPRPSDGHHTIQVFGNSTIGEMFESDIRYFSFKSINIFTPENITYTSPMSGYYPATYGFENDEIGGVPDNWEDNSEGTNSIKVVSQKIGHNHVLRLDDTGSGKVRGIINFSNQSYGTIELWVLAEDCDNGLEMHLINNDTSVLFHTILIENNKWKTSDGTTATIIPAFDGVYDPVDNTWYNIVLHFRGNSAPSYQGLGLNKYNVIIDGSYDSGELDATNVLDSVNKLSIKSRAVAGVDNWVDAVGVSWDPNYNIGDNFNEGMLLSFENSTTLDWKGYSLDGQTNKTILGNATLPMPSDGHHTIQVFGNNTMGEMFESDTTHFSVKAFNIKTPENKTYTEPMNGYYPASYGFENVNNGDLPIVNALANWSDYSPYANCRAEVVSEYLGHKKVLHIDDDNSAGKAYVRINTTNDITSGTLEYWILFESAAAAFILRTMDYDLSEYRFNFGIESGKWVYYFGGGWNNIPAYDGTYDPISNTWYHIRLSFRCEGAPVYNGLGENRFYVEIDDIPSGELEFRTNGADMEYIYFDSQSATTTDTWVDAFSLSWDPNYNIGDNLEEGILLSYDKTLNADWMGYSLDDQANRTILGNTTIPFPSDGVHNIQVFGNNSIGEMFESEKRYFTVEYISIDIVTPENKTYTDPMSGYYPGTYGFENDEDGSLPEDWGKWTSGGCPDPQILNSLDNHNKILEFHDTSSGGQTSATQVLQSNQNSGTIEFWFRTTDRTQINRFYGVDPTGTLALFECRVESSKWQYRTGGVWYDIPNVATPQNNEWMHVRIDFECGFGSYLGLGDDEFYISVDGISSGALSFAANVDECNHIVFITGTVSSNFYMYIDALGYSWSTIYDIGNNYYEGLLVSFENSSALEWFGYSLNNQPNKTILGNTTIPMPTGGQHAIQVFANSSLGYYYESDTMYFTISIEEIIINLNSPETITYIAPMSGYYPASYGFENDAIGSDPRDWSVYEVGGTVNIINTLGNHNKIVEVHSTTGDHARLTNIFAARATGTIECWVRTNTIIDDSIVLRVTDGPSTDELLISVNSATNKWKYHDGGTWYDMIGDVTTNTWYHFRIEFDCADDWHVWIDEVSQDGGIGFGYRDSPSQMDRLIIGTTNQPTNCYAYFDAIGYSWEANYNIGDNLNEGLLLTFTNSSTLEWIGYSLDFQANKTIVGNMVIPMPGNGLHSIQVHGRSTLGHYYGSNLVYFTVDISTPPPPPPPGDDNFILIFILIGVFSIVGVTIAIVVYKKVHTPSIKPKTPKEPKPRKPKVKKSKPKKRGIIEEEVFCPFCQTPITSEHKFCTYCGSDLNEEEEPRN